GEGKPTMVPRPLLNAVCVDRAAVDIRHRSRLSHIIQSTTETNDQFKTTAPGSVLRSGLGVLRTDSANPATKDFSRRTRRGDLSPRHHDDNRQTRVCDNTDR